MLGLAFGHFIMSQNLDFFIEKDSQVLPFWALVIPSMVGILFGLRDVIRRTFDTTMLWLLLGIFINASTWMIGSTTPDFQVAGLIAPPLVWLCITVVRTDMKDYSWRGARSSK